MYDDEQDYEPTPKKPEMSPEEKLILDSQRPL
jgi:hypothetical protein